MRPRYRSLATIGSRIAMLAIFAGASRMTEPTAAAAERTGDQVRQMMKEAESHGLVRHARKTKLVDARAARPGEVVVTVVAGEGKETQSRPARSGDWVVRNRCDATDHEEYLVAAEEFGSRYESTGRPAAKDGWQEFRPLGKVMRFFVVMPEHGEFTFTAPWGEPMVAKPGDSIVQDPEQPADIYRIAAASFARTYEVMD
jgi:hypothetical protein